MLLGCYDIGSFRVANNQIDTIGRIGRVAWNIGGTCLADAKHTHDNSTSAR